MIEDFKKLASKNIELETIKKKYSSLVSEAILIREVENSLLKLFDQGQMNGTVHTCVGQEFSAVAVCNALEKDDWITSNHRCHGHFISKTKKWESLIDELRGFKSGACMGIGSSQHLFHQGFLSNGPQASLIPVGSGIARHLQDQGKKNVCVSFFGEGTLGEGLIYESMNLASVLNLAQVFVLENNLYSQSTPQAVAVSGSFEHRAKAFNLKFFSTNTWDLDHLFGTCLKAISYSREQKKPCFLDIKTYRLNAHSKSDDDRDPEEIEFFKTLDPLNQAKASKIFAEDFESIAKLVKNHIDNSTETRLDPSDYFHDQLPHKKSTKPKNISNPKDRLVSVLNKCYGQEIENGSYFIGEDILDPYGGAFKVSKGLSTKYKNKVIGTPISEAAITGLGIGLSLMGNQSFVEIMFGDFISYAYDQILSNASKFYHMYAFQCSAPVRIRTPMGGKRGYGPTHSQSLEKFFLGMDNVAVFSITSLIDPAPLFIEIRNLDCPAIIVENKVDYGKVLFQKNEFLDAEQIGGALGPVLVKPDEMDPNLTVISYGGTAREIVDGFIEIFEETGFIVQILCIISLNPLNIGPIPRLLKTTKNIVTVEDHSVEFGIGAEIMTNIMSVDRSISFKRIGASPYPVPSIRELEDQSLPTLSSIIKELKIYKNSLEN